MSKVKLLTSDSQLIEVDEDVAVMSVTIKNLIEDSGTEDVIPLPNVSQKVMQKIVKYCKYHVEANKLNENGKPAKTKEDIKAWDAEFIKLEDNDVLFHVVQAANYLDIRSLMDLLCGAIGNMLKGKSTEEIRKTFGIENDFTPEEEEEVRRENQWAYE